MSRDNSSADIVFPEADLTATVFTVGEVFLRALAADDFVAGMTVLQDANSTPFSGRQSRGLEGMQIQEILADLGR